MLFAAQAALGIRSAPQDSSQPVASTPDNQTKIPCDKAHHCKLLAPKLIHTEEPQRLNGDKTRFSGTVQVHMWIPEDGIPTNIKVLQSHGQSVDNAAILAASKYRFRPATENGQPVKVDLYADMFFDWN
jgi:TonB family protein